MRCRDRQLSGVTAAFLSIGIIPFSLLLSPPLLLGTLRFFLLKQIISVGFFNVFGNQCFDLFDRSGIAAFAGHDDSLAIRGFDCMRTPFAEELIDRIGHFLRFEQRRIEGRDDWLRRGPATTKHSSTNTRHASSGRAAAVRRAHTFRARRASPARNATARATASTRDSTARSCRESANPTAKATGAAHRSAKAAAFTATHTS